MRSRMARVRCITQFTCHPHVYPWMEWTILSLLRTHSPDGATQVRLRTSDNSSYFLFIDLERMKGWVGLVGWLYGGRFTHISGHPSATGRAQDRESSPVTVRLLWCPRLVSKCAVNVFSRVSKWIIGSCCSELDIAVAASPGNCLAATAIFSTL